MENYPVKSEYLGKYFQKKGYDRLNNPSRDS